MARAPREMTVEDVPEADRLGAFPHPRHTEAFYGHAAAEAQLATGLASGKLHHAWLLVGPEGIGKATLGIDLLGRRCRGSAVTWRCSAMCPTN